MFEKIYLNLPAGWPSGPNVPGGWLVKIYYQESFQGSGSFLPPFGQESIQDNFEVGTGSFLHGAMAVASSPRQAEELLKFSSWAEDPLERFEHLLGLS